MRRIGLTRASIVLPIVAFLERVGAPVEQLLSRAGIPGWPLIDPEALIPTASTARLLAEAARVEGAENVGLLAGQEASIETLGLYGRLIRRSATLREALEATLHGHSIYCSNSRMWLASHGDDVQLCQTFTVKVARSAQGWQQVDHYILMLLLGIVRLAAGPAWRPTRVDLQTGECAAVRDVEALSGTCLRFAQPATIITIPRSLCDRPLRKPIPPLAIPRRTVDAWKASAPAPDFVGSIAQVVETLSWDGYPDIHVTANFLGMSVRTLQRDLTAAGVTHEALVGRARFATAVSVLAESDTRILDIALDLGYSDHAHFTRAFQRWAGCSPQEYRRRRREGGNAAGPAGS